MADATESDTVDLKIVNPETGIIQTVTISRYHAEILRRLKEAVQKVKIILREIEQHSSNMIR